MTKVQAQYRLERPLDDALLDAVARVHSLYGILRVAPAPDLAGVVVDYDASRLTPEQVHAALRSAGLPLRSEDRR